MCKCYVIKIKGFALKKSLINRMIYYVIQTLSFLFFGSFGLFSIGFFCVWVPYNWINTGISFISLLLPLAVVFVFGLMVGASSIIFSLFLARAIYQMMIGRHPKFGPFYPFPVVAFKALFQQNPVAKEELKQLFKFLFQKIQF